MSTTEHQIAPRSDDGWTARLEDEREALDLWCEQREALAEEDARRDAAAMTEDDDVDRWINERLIRLGW